MRSFLSFFALLVIYTGIFVGFIYYDWGFPITKAVLFTIMAVIVWRLRGAKGTPGNYGPQILRAETVICVLFILLSVLSFVPKAIRCVDQGFVMDTHLFTQRSAEIVFRDKQNPYLSNEMAIYGQDKTFTGYKHGPMMPIGYFLSAFGGVVAYKFTQLVYFLLSAWLVCALVWRSVGATMLQKLTAALFAMALYLAPEQFWFDIFSQGANDIFSIFLLLASIYFFSRDKVFLSGLLAGLSFSAKIFPAYLWAALLFRGGLRIKFYGGFLAGLVPLAVFFAWDPRTLIDNVLVFHLIKNYDSTSLFYIIPAARHWVLTAFQWVFAAVILGYSYKGKYSLETIVADFFLLMITTELFYKEVHNNHLINFIPMLAILLAWKRHSLFMKRVI